MKPIREKHHRLPPECYRGAVKAAFTINTEDKQPLLLGDTVCEITRTALAESFQLHHGHAAVFVFMPEHLHLIVSGQGPESDLLALMKDFKQKTTFRARNAGLVFGWQKDFYDHLIRAREDYGAQVHYLLRNPVRRGLVAHWEHWPHRGVLGQTWEELALNIGTL